MADFSTAFESFLSKVGQALQDASELEVLTLRGSIALTQVDKLDAQGKPIKKKDAQGNEMAETVKELNLAGFFQPTGELSGDIKVVSATRFSLDGDTFLFIADDAPEAMRQAHLEATAAAMDYRKGIVDAALSVFKVT